MSYAINRNGTITVYGSVPSKFQGQNKTYANGFNLLTEAEQQREGLFRVVMPDGFDSDIHELGTIYWDSVNSRFTYPKVDKVFTKTLAEFKTDKIANLKHNLNRKLSETDWYYIRKYDKNTIIPAQVQTDRDALRTSCDTKENAINALTSITDVIKYDITL